MYEIVLSSGAEKDMAQLQKSDRKLFKALLAGLEQLSSDPYLGKVLVGNLKGYYSYRVRDHRILYEITRDALRVSVLKIEHRKQVYR